MPKAIVESMKRGGVKSPYALLNAAGWKEGDTESETKKKLGRFQRRRKRGDEDAETVSRGTRRMRE